MGVCVSFADGMCHEGSKHHVHGAMVGPAEYGDGKPSQLEIGKRSQLCMAMGAGRAVKGSIPWWVVLEQPRCLKSVLTLHVVGQPCADVCGPAF